MSGTIDILRGARELLSEPTRWRKGSLYGKADGLYAGPCDKVASWCLLGALYEAAGPLSIIEACRAITPFLPAKYKNSSGNGCHAKFNDRPDTTHADVLAVLDRAIEAEAAR